MRSIRRSLIALACGVCVASPVFAQQEGVMAQPGVAPSAAVAPDQAGSPPPVAIEYSDAYRVRAKIPTRTHACAL